MTILVAEDNVSLCRGLRLGLEKSGHTVATVHNGEEALERIKKNDIAKIGGEYDTICFNFRCNFIAMS